MIDNVWVHSNANEPPLFCYQTARGGLSFAVTDMGIGSPSDTEEEPSLLTPSHLYERA